MFFFLYIIFYFIIIIILILFDNIFDCLTFKIKELFKINDNCTKYMCVVGTSYAPTLN